VLSGPRLRQVALVARDCGRVAGELLRAFGWPPPYHDPGVGRFGLTNAVFAVGDTFVEVVAPAQPDTTAGRYLNRRGGDGGYMAIFQVPDLATARRRVADLGVRVVWTADLPDIAATHLHPRDVPGAIVSLDWAAPEQSWRWAGPSWTGQVPRHLPGGVTGLTIEVNDPAAAARRWAAVLGISPADSGHTTVVELPDPGPGPGPGQRLRFVPAGVGRGEGIAEVTIAGLPVQGEGEAGGGPWVIGGVRFAGQEG
jgi:Glyoxalase-like domain